MDQYFFTFNPERHRICQCLSRWGATFEGVTGLGTSSFATYTYLDATIHVVQCGDVRYAQGGSTGKETQGGLNIEFPDDWRHAENVETEADLIALLDGTPLYSRYKLYLFLETLVG